MKTVSDTAFRLACSIVGISPEEPENKYSPYWLWFRIEIVCWAKNYLN